MLHTIRFILLSGSLLTLISCGGGAGSGTKNADGKEWEKGKDYTVLKRFRLEDKQGFGEPITAYSLLLPDDWTVSGGINWVANGLCVNELIVNRMSAKSPDGGYEFESFPLKSWNWFDNQMMVQATQQQNASGFKACDVMPAYNAEAYLRNVFAPEVGVKQIKSVSDFREVSAGMEKVAADTKNSLQQAGITNVSYNPTAIIAQVVFADGKEGLAVVAVNQTINQMPDYMQGGYSNGYVCSADSKLLLKYPKGQEKEAKNLLSMIISSVRINPAWQNAAGQIMQNIAKGQQIENAKRQAIWHEAQNAISESQRSTWENQQASNDRINEEFSRTIRGVEQWSDPTTGDKVDLTLGYSEAWSKGDGTYILSNNPLFDPTVALQEDWKKLEKK